MSDRFPSQDDVDAAIARIEESRQTHVQWFDWWRDMEAHTCPTDKPCWWGDHVEDDARVVTVAGDCEHHAEAIAGYDHVLDVLRSLRSPTHVVWWRESDVNDQGNVHPVAIATLGEPTQPPPAELERRLFEEPT